MNRYISLFLSSVISGLAVLLFSLNIISSNTKKMNDLIYDNILLTSQIDELESIINKSEFIVTGTIYSPTRAQCDDTPNITADGTRINPKRASQYRFIALSRDLLKRWGGPFNYGDYVLIEGTKNGKYDGLWQVRDTMSSRWVKRVDFLVDIGTLPFKENKIKMIKTG